MDRWTLLCADLDGTNRGEIRNASDRSFSWPLDRLATGKFRVRLDHPLADVLLEADCLIKAYQQTDDDTNPVLRMVAEVVTAEESAEDMNQSIAVTFAEAGFWRLTKRLVGKTAGGLSVGTALLPVDRGLIAQFCLISVNSEADTGVRVGTITASANGFVGPWYFKPVSEAILELSSTLDGFDFRFDPVEPVRDATGLVVARFTASGALGQVRPEAIFEYGTGKKNIKSYKRQVTKDGLLTKGYHLPAGYPESTEPVVTSQDLPATAARGLMEGLVTSDLTTAQLRSLLVQEHVQIRKQPRQIISFDPAIGGMVLNRDLVPGDVVTARAKIGGSVRFNGLFRVYEAEVSLDDNGAASYSLSLVTNQ